MKKTWKKLFCRLLAGTMAGVLLMGTAGCKGGEKEEKEKEVVMGRYLEEEIPLPEGAQGIVEATRLSDGKLALLGYDEQYMTHYWQSADDGETWEEQGNMPQELKLADGEQQTAMSVGAIRQDGAVLCVVTTYDVDTADVVEDKTYIRNTDGTYTEVNMKYPDGFTQAIDIKWLSDQEVIVQDSVVGLYEMDLSDGSVKNQFIEEGQVFTTFGIVENYLIVVGADEISYYDLDTGKIEEEDSALTEQIKNSGADQNLTSYGTSPLLICQKGKDGKLFYCDSTGIYSHVIKGNAMEQVVDGKLNSIGDPSVGLMGMFLGDENAIYLAVSTGEEHQLLKYAYSKDTPSVPSKEIKIYALEENAELQQAISLFQKENPDYYVSLEVGMSEDNSITATDALKTLNTEIMAGKGPDLLMLDGMPGSTYEEKGMLSDISDVIEKVDKSEGILDNIQEAYTKENEIYEFPGRFSIPLVVGPKDQIEAMQTLEGLTKVAERYSETNDSVRLFSDMTPEFLSESLVDGAYAAWIQEDRTLDENLLKEYFESVKKLYDTDSHDEQLRENVVMQNYPHLELSYVDGMVLQIYGKECAAAVGNLASPDGFSQITSCMNNMEDTKIDYEVWNGQKEGCFSPVMLMGVNSKSKNQEEAKAFLEFLYSEKAQRLSMGYGLTVNEKVYDSQEYWAVGDGTTVGYTVQDGDGVERQVFLNMENSSADQVKKIQEIGKSLNTPSQLDKTVMEAVRGQLTDYIDGKIELDEAVQNVIQKVNLYLAE